MCPKSFVILDHHQFIFTTSLCFEDFGKDIFLLCWKGPDPEFPTTIVRQKYWNGMHPAGPPTLFRMAICLMATFP